MKQLSLDLDYESHRKIVIAFLSAALLLNFLVTVALPFVYFLLRDFPLDPLMPSFAYIQHYQTLFGLQFIFVSLTLRKRFQLLNHFLRFCLDN